MSLYSIQHIYTACRTSGEDDGRVGVVRWRGWCRWCRWCRWPRGWGSHRATAARDFNGAMCVAMQIFNHARPRHEIGVEGFGAFEGQHLWLFKLSQPIHQCRRGGIRIASWHGVILIHIRVCVRDQAHKRNKSHRQQVCLRHH